MMNATIAAAQRIVLSFFGQIFSSHGDVVANETVVAAAQNAPTSFLGQLLRPSNDVVVEAFNLIISLMRAIPAIPAALLTALGTALTTASWYLGVGIGFYLLFLTPFLCWMGIWCSVIPMVSDDRSILEDGAAAAFGLILVLLSIGAQIAVLESTNPGPIGFDARSLIAAVVSSFLGTLTGIVIFAAAVAAMVLLAFAATWVVCGVSDVVSNCCAQAKIKDSIDNKKEVKTAAVTSNEEKEGEGKKQVA